MTRTNIFRDISQAVRYFFNHKEKVRIFLLSYAVKVLGGCDLGAVFRSRHASGSGQTRSSNARRKPCIFFARFRRINVLLAFFKVNLRLTDSPLVLSASSSTKYELRNQGGLRDQSPHPNSLAS